MLALSAEEEGKLDPFVASKGINYSVGVGGRWNGWGSGGIPHAYLVAPDGTVAWEGHPASLKDGQIEDLLRKVQKFYLRPVAPELKQAAAAFKKGKLVTAKALAKQATEVGRLDDTVKTDAEYVIARVDELLATWKKQVEMAEASASYNDAYDVLDMIKKHFAGSEDAKWAVEKKKALKADPEVKRELKAQKSLHKLFEEGEKAAKNSKKRAALIKKVEKFVNKWEGTKTAKRAESFLDSLRNPGKK